MSKSEATPGPWTTQPTTKKGNGTDWRDILAPTPFGPAYIGECLVGDAALICAAPAMRDALRDIASGRVVGENAAALARCVLGAEGGAR